MKQKTVVYIIGALMLAACVIMSLLYWRDPETTVYIDASFSVVIILLTVFGIFMLRRKKPA